MVTRKLGKGLDSLLSTRHAQENNSADGVLWISVSNLLENSQQPRLHTERGLERLSNSIRKHGIMQPIVATALPGDRFEILAGERRWRAAQMAGLKKVPILVRDGVSSEAERLELSLIENIQREDLDPIERAKACQKLLEEFGLTQEEVAMGLGYDRSTIANLVRLMELPQEIQDGVSRGTLSAGHARALLRLSNNKAQAVVFKRLIDDGWSVRQTEAACASALKGKLDPSHKSRPRQPAWVSDLQDKLMRTTGLRSEIRIRRGGGGRLVFHFQSLDELDRMTQSLDTPSEADELLGS
ncbi:MAG: ParB/RepB/Spo0J family partition protein [Planctomycetota bacterium]|nr:ParB/RepB/Spo0J family partition protein [Planctomycetota bacterium]